MTEKSQPPFLLQGLDHLVLRVVDLQKSLAFYLDVLGGVLEREQVEIGLHQVRVGASLIDLVPIDGVLGRRGGAAPGREARNLDHLCLAISPFDETAICAHLQAHGVEIGESGLRYGATGEGPSIYIQDPDGNGVELKGVA